MSAKKMEAAGGTQIAEPSPLSTRGEPFTKKIMQRIERRKVGELAVISK